MSWFCSPNQLWYNAARLGLPNSMSELSEIPTDPEEEDNTLRCPHCDSVITSDATQCLMCGRPVDSVLVPIDDGIQVADKPPLIKEAPEDIPPNNLEVFESVMREKRSRPFFWVILIITLGTFICGFAVLRTNDSEIILALVPTSTPFPPTYTYTPTLTPPPTETSQPTATPTLVNTPVPTDTPRPPRFHSVAAGETMFGLSLFYRISAESIANENGVPLNSPIQVGQQLSIPWPTATPPLESLVMDIKGEQVIADVTDCEIVTIAEGDSAYGLSAQKGVPAEAIIAVNRLTEETIQLLHPGDTLCIPRIIYGDALPPTAGPSPTITLTSFPRGPHLLYPVDEQEIENPDGLLTLQWVAVKDLDENEWYMVELLDMDVLDALPFRGFTRDTAFHVPSSWRPVQPEPHQMRWKVSIVQVTGDRSDGEFIYRYGGRSSEEAFFIWLGAIPTPTPTPTPVPTETTQP